MAYGESFLSKVIDANDTGAFLRYDIRAEHFLTEAERKAYRFIKDYADSNGGQAPDYRTVVAECADFTYMPEVGDSFEYMAKKIRNDAGKVRLHSFLTGRDVSDKFSELPTEEFAAWLVERVEEVQVSVQTKKSIGRSLGELSIEMRDEYNKRKEGKSFRLWKTPFNALNEAIGGLFTGDIYGVMAESGRGKSYLIIVLIDELLRQGATVLVKSFELKAFLWVSRLLSVATARDEAFVDERTNQSVGLPNKEILAGKLEGDVESYFFDILTRLNEYYPGKLVLQAKGDRDLTRSLTELERELKLRPDIDVVVVDPFYGISDVYGSNANKTTGGAAEQAARKFERIVGENDVVGIYAVQATVEKKTREEGDREIKLPTRDQVKTTKALLDIATNLFSFDSADGNAQLGIEKGRNGAEDLTVDLIALMDYGVLRELPSGEAAADQFKLPF
ncbi:AAA family ATPase [Brevibacillus laterosporus]|uniref:AAA family ATPase n=1 Tax=Brevibacillus laterosporus TaxID=1465 RepID=UPI00215B8D23|nr:AAA family ATPase [Brevibacillus laterosporus]MCR8938742.1 AAA family ATPase [Brevibacillus laterosporus]MCZ0841382.1 AAA family ATPase [Brevibacillus laterosporus]